MSTLKDASEVIEEQAEHIDAKRQHEVDAIIRSLRSKLKEKDRGYKMALADLEMANDQLEVMGAVQDRVADIEPIEPMLSEGKGEALAVGILSDIHPSVRIRPETVGGKNEHNLEVSKKRQQAFFKGFCRLTEIERSGQNVPRALIFLGGDVTGNMIHDELKETNLLTPQQEVLFELDRIEEGLIFLQENGGFKDITVVCSHGNHDRDTKEKQFENHAEHSLTWTLYHVLKRDFDLRNKENKGVKGYSPVKFEIATGYLTVKEIYGRKVRFHHGDAIKYSGGVGGPTIAINKALDKWNMLEHVDLDLFGHMHWSMSDQRFFCNGSVCGYSSYALHNKYPFEVPRQWFLLLDKKRWLTSQRYIYL